jgi:DNA polymerase III epsilon subunit family exonuclease
MPNNKTSLKDSSLSSENSGRVYCSLDIETTGFDPAVDEILEIGFVFFTLEKNKIKLGKEYTWLFKPKQAVTQIILGLTGITQEELDKGVEINDCLQEIQTLLKGAIIVGHNINFDLGFLRSLGLQFESGEIDTLDLAQFILPTHQSYNLENLMHYFGVPHTEAHRALADAKATVKVLQGLLASFAGFQADLKQEIIELSESQKFLWTESLKCFAGGKAEKLKTKKHQPTPGEAVSLPQISAFNNYPLSQEYIRGVAQMVSKQTTPYIVVVPGNLHALEISQATGLSLYFLEEYSFNHEKFLALKHKPEVSKEELKFILKILVWQKTNWQNANLADLNLSFFGGQYKHLINDGKLTPLSPKQKYVCDYDTFASLSKEIEKQKFNIIFCGLNELEQAISARIGRKISWGKINYLLKNIYNPDTGVGEAKFKEVIVAGLSDADLFFGLTNALLQSNPPGFLSLKISDIEVEKLEKIQSAAKNFSEKLRHLAELVNHSELATLAKELLNYFLPEENMVKWLEMSATACIFIKSPIEISRLTAEIFKAFKSVSLVDSIPARSVWDLYQIRLGLDKYTYVENVQPILKDLFSFLKPKTKYKVEVCPQALTESKILSLLSAKALPGAVLFGNALEVKNFYFNNLSKLQDFAFLHPQLGSSGNKILRNFSIHKHSLLLASDKFVLKATAMPNAPSVIGKLAVKTLIIGHIPFEQFTHPYLEAVSKSFKNSFEQYSVPKALFNLHKILSLFMTENLKQIILYEEKLNKAYSQPFLRYLEKLTQNP